nr:hypothetical protein JVH1_1117 [Rhodococcus sp. JVH1]
MGFGGRGFRSSPWLLVDDVGGAIEPIRRYLVEVSALGSRQSAG